MTERLLDWFMRRRENIVIRLVHDHLERVVDAVIELNRAIKAVKAGERDEVDRCIKRLFMSEDEADEIRRKILGELTMGELPSKDREDLMHLVKRIDAIADWARDSSHNLRILTEAELPKEMWEMMSTMGESLVKCSTAVKVSLEKLSEGPEEVIKASREVDKIEHEIDDMYFNLRRTFLGVMTKVPPSLLVIIRDLLHDMEQVADSCEDAVDIIRVLTIREYRPVSW